MLSKNNYEKMKMFFERNKTRPRPRKNGHDDSESDN